MTRIPAPPLSETALAPRLEPDPIGIAQDTLLGATAAPGVSAGLTLAALADASDCVGGPVIIVTGNVLTAVSQNGLRSLFFRIRRESGPGPARGLALRPASRGSR